MTVTKAAAKETQKEATKVKLKAKPHSYTIKDTQRPTPYHMFSYNQEKHTPVWLSGKKAGVNLETTATMHMRNGKLQRAEGKQRHWMNRSVFELRKDIHEIRLKATRDNLNKTHLHHPHGDLTKENTTQPQLYHHRKMMTDQ